MNDRWEFLSAWHNAWLDADEDGRQRLRRQLAAERPELAAEADALATASGDLSGFLETPALVLAARQLADDEPVVPAGALIGPYRVVSFLARGGMGDVYRATDIRLRRDVALKVLSASRTGDPQRVERFMHEARVTASIDHPNVVRVYDVGQVGTRAYLVAELLEGETLRARIARGPLAVPDALRTAVEIARGLVAAHAAGLVHRDLKPENVYLTQEGTTKLLDFGIAKLAQDESVPDGRSTLTGVVLGTAGYLAPEQIRGEPVDARADLFSFGAVLFEMLTGARAFARDHLVDTLHAILHDDPPDTLATRGDVPPSLAVLVHRLLEKAPAARLQSSAELLAELQRIETVPAGEPRPEKRSPTEARVGTAAPRARAARWTLPALGIALLAALAAAWYGNRTPVPPEGETPSMILAVLPLRSIPPGADVGRLLEIGLADVFISRLGQLAEVRVLPLSATERLGKATDPAAAAGRLGATHVLTGTLQREQGRVRATVHLTAIADGRVLWSAPVDTDSSSIFSIQDIIVSRVVEELAPHVAAGTRRRLARPGTFNNEAYEEYLRGRAYVGRPTRAELTRAAHHFREAVRLDERYADAWAGLASAWRRMPLFDVSPAEGFGETKRAAVRALALDSSNAEAQSALGTVAFWYDWDFPRAEAQLRRALDLQPSSTDAAVSLAHMLSNLGRHDEALVEIRRARALDPAWPVPRSLEGQFLFMARRYEDALAHLTALVAAEPHFYAARIMRMYPLIALQRYQDAILECEQGIRINQELGAPRPHSFALALRGYALARANRLQEAGEALAALRRQAREQYVPPHHEALLLHALGRDAEALRRLEDAVAVRDLFVTFLAVDSKWDALRDSPPFRRVLSQAHLLDVSDRQPR
jgi:serine/threonine-protein kinase